MSPNFSKAKLRKILLSYRRQIPFPEREAAAKKAVALLLKINIFQRAQEIACYYPFHDEFDCLPMIKAIWRANKNCYLPIVTETQQLNFALYQNDTVLQPNRYQIPEPIHDKTITPDKLDLVLIPLLGFDKQGNRLGMGAGYYDRTFETHQHTQKPFLLGLGYEVQCISDIPKDEWDVTLDGVMTEKNCYFF